MAEGLLQLLLDALSVEPARVKAATGQLRELETTPGYYSTMMTFSCQKDTLAEEVRWLAAVMTKNGIDKYWRKSAFNALSEETKAFIRATLLTTLDEPSNQIAVQLAVLVSKIARHDVPDKWPELLPTLVQNLQSPLPTVQQRSIRMLSMVIKTVSRKKIPSAGRQISEVAPALFYQVHQLWVAQLDEFFRLCRTHHDTPLPATTREQMLQNLHLCFFGLKTLRYTFAYCLKEPIPDELTGAHNFVDLLLKAAQSFIGVHIALGESHGPFRETLVKTIVQIGKTLLDIQTNKARMLLSSPAFLPLLVFCHDQLLASTRNKLALLSLVGLIIRMIVLLQNTAKKFVEWKSSQSLQPDQYAALTVLSTFWTDERQQQLYELLITQLLPLDESEITQMQKDPEEFIIYEDTVSLMDSLRTTTESAVGFLTDRLSVVTVPVFLRLLAQAVDIPVDSSAQAIVFKEAVYNVLSVSAFTLYNYVDMDSLLSSKLIPEAAHPTHWSALILRRRLAILIEQWVSVKMSPGIRPLVYQVLNSLMGDDQATVVRLAAARSIRQVINDFDFDLPVFQPYLENTFILILNILQKSESNDTSFMLLDCLLVVISRGGTQEQLRPLLGAILTNLPALWEGTGTDLQLKLKLIMLTTKIVEAFSDGSVALHVFVLPVLRFCMDPNQETVLLEQGLQLWLATVQNCPNRAPEELWTFFPRACDIMAQAGDMVRDAAYIITAYLLLELSPVHLMAGVPSLSKTFGWALDLKADYFKGQTLGVVMKVMDVMLQRHSELAWAVLQPCLPTYGNALMQPEVNAPILVHFAYLNLLSRMLLQCRDMTLQLLFSAGDKGLQSILDTWTDKLTSFGQPSQAKLNALAISTLLSVQHPVVVKNIESIVNVTMGVFYQTTSGDLSTGNVQDNLMYDDDEDAITQTLLEGSPEHTRRRELMKHDPIYAKELRTHIKEQVQIMQHVYGIAQANQILGSIDSDLQIALQKICIS